MRNRFLTLFLLMTCFVSCHVSEDYNYYPDPRSETQGFRAVIDGVEVFGYNRPGVYYTPGGIMDYQTRIQYRVVDSTYNYYSGGVKLYIDCLIILGNKDGAKGGNGAVFLDDTVLEKFSFRICSDKSIKLKKKYWILPELRYTLNEGEPSDFVYRAARLDVKTDAFSSHEDGFQGVGWFEIESWDKYGRLRFELDFTGDNREYHLRDGLMTYPIDIKEDFFMNGSLGDPPSEENINE